MLIMSDEPNHAFIYKAWLRVTFLLVLLTLLLVNCPVIVLAQEYIEYEIKEGDCLWSIARQFQLSIQEVTEANNIDEKELLLPGLLIKIPQNETKDSHQSESVSTVIHTVQKGESLWDIAQQYRLSLDELSRVNELAKPDSLYIGQQIKVPISNSKEDIAKDNDSKPVDLSFESERTNLKEITSSINEEFQESVKEISYEVKPGENLWTIAQHYQVSLKELSQVNELENTEKLSIGQIIKIPLGTKQTDDKSKQIENTEKESEDNWVEHIVEYGESISLIAQKYRIPMETICQLNQISPKDYVYPGQRLKIKVSEQSATEIVPMEVAEQNKSSIEPDSPQVEQEPVYYTVKPGDTLWTIAQQYGVSMEGIVAVNYLTNKDILSVGQKLEIPAMGGDNVRTKTVEYTVVKGDTLWNIAQKFGVRMHEIININQLENITQLAIGQKLNIPVTALATEQAAGKSSVAKEEVQTKDVVHYVQKGETLWEISRKYQVSLQSITSANRISETSRIYVGQKLVIPNARNYSPSSSLSFIWPLKGLITSQFGVRTLGGRRDYHTGLDIDGNSGASIRAAESGKVSFNGYINGYGYTIIIDHRDGYSTVYAHNSANLVKVGQSVNKGDIIARVGATGNATGSHLHFEIREKGKPVNPLNYLP